MIEIEEEIGFYMHKSCTGKALEKNTFPELRMWELVGFESFSSTLDKLKYFSIKFLFHTTTLPLKHFTKMLSLCFQLNNMGKRSSSYRELSWIVIKSQLRSRVRSFRRPESDLNLTWTWLSGQVKSQESGQESRVDSYNSACNWYHLINYLSCTDNLP